MTREVVHSHHFHGVSDPLLQIVDGALNQAPRGFRIGRPLVSDSNRFARAQGYATLSLWTNDILVAAQRIYEAAGFKMVREERHHGFGHDLVDRYRTLGLD